MTDINNDSIRETAPDYMVNPDEDHGEIFATAEYETSEGRILGANTELNMSRLRFNGNSAIIYTVISALLFAMSHLSEIAFYTAIFFAVLAGFFAGMWLMLRINLKKSAANAFRDRKENKVSYFFYEKAINRRALKCDGTLNDEWTRYSELAAWDESKSFLYYICDDRITLIPKTDINGDVDRVRALLSGSARKNENSMDKKSILSLYALDFSMFIMFAVMSVLDYVQSIGEFDAIHFIWLLLIPIGTFVAVAVHFFIKRKWLTGIAVVIAALFAFEIFGSTVISLISDSWNDGFVRLDNAVVDELSERTGIDFPDNINVYGIEYDDEDGYYSEKFTVKRLYTVYFKSNEEAELFEEKYLYEDFWYYSDGGSTELDAMVPYPIVNGDNVIYSFIYDINGNQMNGFIPSSEEVDMYYVAYDPKYNDLIVVEYTINVKKFLPCGEN